MRSSKTAQRVSAAPLVVAYLLLGACAGASPVGGSAAAVCAGPANAPEHTRTRLSDFRRSVESGPLYTGMIAAASISRCKLDYDDGVMSVSYRLGDGSVLRVLRDSRIEYSEQEALFASPPPEAAVAILQRAELQAYGHAGCGIAWDKPEKRARESDSTVEVYRGDVCNCNARIRRDSRGGVTALALRRAC